MKNETTLLVQGRKSNTFLDNIDNYIPHFNKIVYSTWKDGDDDYSDFNLDLIINDLPVVNEIPPIAAISSFVKPDCSLISVI